MKRIFASRRTRWAAIVILIVLPAMLAAYSVFEFRRPNSFGEDHGFLNFFANNSDWILGLLFLAISAVPFLLVFERRRPQARELVPIAVMSALAVVGRTVFSIVPLPNFKPCSAIIMITAIVFGPETGFLTGALTAFVSNFIFGQGPWTPWQMFTWGLLGFLTGLMKNAGLFPTVGHIIRHPKPRFTSPKWPRRFISASSQDDRARAAGALLLGTYIRLPLRLDHEPLLYSGLYPPYHMADGRGGVCVELLL